MSKSKTTKDPVQVFKAKPVPHSAVQLDGTNHKEIVEWINANGGRARNGGPKYIKLWVSGSDTESNNVRVGDFVVLEPSECIDPDREDPTPIFFPFRKVDFQRYFSIGKLHTVV